MLSTITGILLFFAVVLLPLISSVAMEEEEK